MKFCDLLCNWCEINEPSIFSVATGEYYSRALETLHSGSQALVWLLDWFIFCCCFVFVFVFLPAWSHINPEKWNKKKWKRRTREMANCQWHFQIPLSREKFRFRWTINSQPICPPIHPLVLSARRRSLQVSLFLKHCSRRSQLQNDVHVFKPGCVGAMVIFKWIQ